MDANWHAEKGITFSGLLEKNSEELRRVDKSNNNIDPEEEAQLLIDLGSRLEAAMGDAGEDDMGDMEDMDDMGAMDDEPADDMGPEDEPEEDPMMQEEIVQEVLKRVTQRIIREKMKRK